ncbi:hypothetical protein L1987_54990 [Smallanthus sonchifolius]|uniref:Uncharacterized protein n=1 Tax=Smallanthus sonchifolius TaxID=185202 RepID=A0ACB9E944_9ASTR|nr:hypothetical protein L1987_54990 [Smallanthus sonchifolius]
MTCMCVVNDGLKYRNSFPSAADLGFFGLHKVVNCIKKLAELLHHDSATIALEVIKEVLSISPNSEKLLEMKGEAFYEIGFYSVLATATGLLP